MDESTLDELEYKTTALIQLSNSLLQIVTQLLKFVNLVSELRVFIGLLLDACESVIQALEEFFELTGFICLVHQVEEILIGFSLEKSLE